MALLPDVFMGKQTTTSTGTDLTLIAAPTGYNNFVGDVGDQFLLMLVSSNGADREVGLFTIASNSPTVLTRPTTPYTNGGTPITLAAGTHTVRSISYPTHVLGDTNNEINCHGARLTEVKCNYNTLATVTYAASYTLSSTADPWRKMVLTGNVDFIFDIDDVIPDGYIREVNMLVQASGGSRDVSISGGTATTVPSGEYAVINVIFFYNKFLVLCHIIFGLNLILFS